MKNGLVIKKGIVIPSDELEITTSRAGGPGGQHVNKTNTRITVRWNAKETQALNDLQKALVLQNLETELTADGELIIHQSQYRSQQRNKESALAHLSQKIKKALYVPKRRKATTIPRTIKESRLQSKRYKSTLKKSRTKNYEE